MGEPSNNGRDTVTVFQLAHDGHDGPGWYYVIDDYPDEGSCGAFETRDEAVAHATEAGYSANAAPGGVR